MVIWFVLWFVVSAALGAGIGLLQIHGVISEKIAVVCIGLITVLGCAFGGWLGVHLHRKERDLRLGRWMMQQLLKGE